MEDEYCGRFLEEMQQALERERAELINKSHVARSELRDRERAPGDSIDVSVEEQGTSTELRLKDRERNLLAKINEAIVRLHDGEYGYCEECGEAVGEARLRARPVAELCIECKEEQEREEQRLNQGHPGLFSVMTHQD